MISGDTANSTAPAPVFGGFGAIKPLVSSSNSDSAASGIPASSPFSGFGLPASASKASDSSITAASTAAPSIPSFTGFGASFGKTPGIVSTVSASASAPALFGFGGNAVNNKPPDAVSSTSTAVPTFAPFGSLAKPAAPSSSGNPFGGGPSLQPSSDLPSTFQFGVPQPSTGLANGTSSAAGQGLFVFGGGNSGQAVGGEQQQAAPSINLFGAPSDSSATSFQLGGDSQFSNAFSYK
ncbi:hypothetical protein WR25_19338 [Diploscapter pachys]|uniref:Uncharacterized protein n=1 Tax=Diploscapter pachys TaxID=2018661 RepID=A0A2A2K2D5_9BILA|nr:hypothetical protein WR25_19338 [Diploscapter pachys]